MKERNKERKKERRKERKVKPSRKKYKKSKEMRICERIWKENDKNRMNQRKGVRLFKTVMTRRWTNWERTMNQGNEAKEVRIQQNKTLSGKE